MPTVLCLATNFKGTRFLHEARDLGCDVILLTRSRCQHEPWPHAELLDFYHMPALDRFPDILRAVSYLARERPLDFIFPLDERDVGTAARLREYLCLDGMGASAARLFRDKLAMRVQADRGGVLVPQFVHLMNDEAIADFAARVPPPWMVKPRSEAGSLGIRTLRSGEELARCLAELGEDRADYLLERFVGGDIYHVDSLTWAGQLAFVQPHRCDLPPFRIWNEGGVFASRSLAPEDPHHSALLAVNQRLLSALGMERGVTHAEFIRCPETGRFYFLEVAARVAGANLDMLIEKASGVCLWREWARMELAHRAGQPYRPPARRYEHGGLLSCLSRCAQPDMAPFRDAAWILRKPNHAGLVVAGPDHAWVQQRLDDYRQRLTEDYLAVLPPLQRAL